MKVVLELNTDSKISKHEVEIGKKTTVGRSSKNVIQLNDDRVSSIHCEFLLTKDSLEIKDLDSKNGVYLNGIRIESSEFFTGDEIRIGQTICTIDELQSDPDAIDFLTFPGRTKDRIAFELRADFTGARTQNQVKFKKQGLPLTINPPTYHIKEVAIRKKAKSPIRLSKTSIRENNKVSSVLSNLVDFICFFVCMILPIYITTSFSKQLTEEVLMISIISLELFFIGNYYIYNYKKRKFTIGESLCGIQKMYEEQ